LLHRGWLRIYGKLSKIRRLSILMVNYYEDDEAKSEPVAKKIYIIINDEKHYIDPEISKKYGLDRQEVSFFSGRKLHVEKG
jgi:hypothetical protein